MITRCLSFTFIVAIVTSYSTIYTQTDEASIRDQVLKEISADSEERTKQIEGQILQLNARIQAIDTTLLNSTTSEQETINKLKERIEILEARQAAQKSREISVFQTNFQTAVINLVSMKREIKPLELFEASKEFYGQVTNLANPTQYDGFGKWYKSFKSYLDINKSKDATLAVTANILETANDLTNEVGIGGAISDVLFSSIGKFINTLGGRKRAKLRQESEEMFQLVMALSQYTMDKEVIEDDWDNIASELEELKVLHDATLQKMFRYLQIDTQQFRQHYLEQYNAINRLNYLNSIKDLAGSNVKLISENNSNGGTWKDSLYRDMQTIQSLKIRFGQATMRIHSNIQSYSALVSKYDTNPFIGKKIAALNANLVRLSKAFDSAYNPQKYISDAVRMYHIY